MDLAIYRYRTICSTQFWCTHTHYLSERLFRCNHSLQWRVYALTCARARVCSCSLSMQSFFVKSPRAHNFMRSTIATEPEIIICFEIRCIFWLPFLFLVSCQPTNVRIMPFFAYSFISICTSGANKFPQKDNAVCNCVFLSQHDFIHNGFDLRWCYYV